MEPYALYVHVPWCRQVCPYCDFNVYAAAVIPEADDVRAYRAELAAWAATPAWAGRPIASVSLGGGTPSLLSAAAVAALVEAALGHGLANDAEVALEANPGTLDATSLRALRAAGVTRLSLGAQSFSPATLRTLGRDHVPDDTRAAVAGARGAGVPNVSLDLIFAVPGQSLDEWADDLDQALALDPDQVSAYALTWEPRTAFDAWRRTGRLVPVDDDLECAMADLADERLTAAGLLRYEISSWARPGFESRHNVRYWDGSDYLGIGPGAHSFSAGPPARRWWNVRHPARWRAVVGAQGVAVEGEERLGVGQAQADFLITGLRRIAGADMTAFERRFGIPAPTAFPQLEGLRTDGLVVVEGGRLRLTARGLRFADTVGALLV
jgi:oxygen-independent coproporphyrinogen-3 oxidase